MPEDIPDGKYGDWEKFSRNSGLVEWICVHGIGHPDHKSAKELGRKHRQGEAYMIHGCDGCCGSKDYPGKIKI